MKIPAIGCNLLASGFVGLDLMNEGLPVSPLYWAFTLVALLVPLVSCAVIFRFSSRVAAQPAIALTTLVIAGNVLLFGLVVWAVVVRYPYPEGNSIIPFALLLLVAPVLSLIVMAGDIHAAKFAGERR